MAVGYASVMPKDIRKTYCHQAINVLYKWGNDPTQGHLRPPKTTEANRSDLGVCLSMSVVVDAMGI